MSVDLSWTVDAVDGVRFVACRVHNEADVARRVRVDSRLSGPVLPPRRSGVPEPGWDRGGVTLRLDPDERRGIGFASPAPPADPPIELVDVEPLADDDTGVAPAVPNEAVRTLGEHRPPGDVVAGDLADRERTAADGGTAATSIRSAPSAPRSDDGVDGNDAPTRPSRSGSDPTRPLRSKPEPTDIGPARIDDWFDAVERRIERAERLTDADLDSATEAIAVLGGTDAVADLEDRIADDGELLRRASERAASLADRAEETDVPVEALERLA